MCYTATSKAISFMVDKFFSHICFCVRLFGTKIVQSACFVGNRLEVCVLTLSQDKTISSSTKHNAICEVHHCGPLSFMYK